MRTILFYSVLLFVSNLSFGYTYTHYSQFKINFLGTDHCVVGIESKNRTGGHLFVMNENTKEHYYTVNGFKQPSSVFLMPNKDYLMIQDEYYDEHFSMKSLKLFYKGQLVDSITQKISMKEVMKRIDNEIYYQFTMQLDSLNTIIHWENATYSIDEAKQKFLPVLSTENHAKAIHQYYEMSTKIWEGDLKINGVKAEEWFRNQIDTSKIKNFEVILTMNDFKLEQFDLHSMDGNTKQETNAQKELKKMLNEAIITDEQYLSRLGAWNYQLVISE